MHAGGTSLFGEDEKFEYTPYEAVYEMYEECLKKSNMDFCDEERARLAALTKALSKALYELERLVQIEKNIANLLGK